tara:strand:- start:832 stop:1530 length:699 start_codon:yes stop_codon:yes gene_type:complete
MSKNSFPSPGPGFPGTDVTSGDSFEASGNPSKTLCYCNQRMFIHIYGDWDHTTTASVMSTFIEVTYGVGCEDEEAEYFDLLESEFEGDRNTRGTFSINWSRSTSVGKCPKGSDVEPGLGDVGDDCTFTWGSYTGSIFENADCANQSDSSTGDGGVVKVCVPPGWSRGLIGNAEYAKRCPQGGFTPPSGGWCDMHPINYEFLMKLVMTKFLDDHDMSWEDSSTVFKKCKELQS